MTGRRESLSFLLAPRICRPGPVPYSQNPPESFACEKSVNVRIQHAHLFACILLSLQLLQCGRDAEMLKETSREPNASLRFSSFRHTLYKGAGQMKFDVRADEAFIYQNGEEVQRIVAYGFTMKQADPRDPVEISGKRGELDYAKKIVLVEGDCSLKDSKSSLTGNRITYDLEKKVATSSEPVSMLRGGTRTDCTGGIVFERTTDRMLCRSPRGNVVQTPGQGKREQKKTPSPEDLFQ